MKYSTQDLLLALEVRDLAVRRRLHSAPENLSPAEQAKWANAQAIDPFVTEVVAELEGIAQVIEQARSN